jgi:hypothetical protein
LGGINDLSINAQASVIKRLDREEISKINAAKKSLANEILPVINTLVGFDLISHPIDHQLVQGKLYDVDSEER